MKVSIFESDFEYHNQHHNHNHNHNLSNDLPDNIKVFVREKFEEDIEKPNAILAEIKRKNLPEPTKSKLVSYMKRLRRADYGQTSISFKEIHAWCNEKIEMNHM